MKILTKIKTLANHSDSEYRFISNIIAQNVDQCKHFIAPYEYIHSTYKLRLGYISDDKRLILKQIINNMEKFPAKNILVCLINNESQIFEVFCDEDVTVLYGVIKMN